MHSIINCPAILSPMRKILILLPTGSCYELTGLRDIYLRQFHVFGSPGRISQERDLRWLRETTGLPVERVVTVAYYSLIKIDESRREPGEEE